YAHHMSQSRLPRIERSFLSMAKGSVRKKGKKWYGRFYIEDESGRKVQKEFAGTESKAETEAMLRKAIADYEEKQFVGKAENITVGDMLDMILSRLVDTFISRISLTMLPVPKPHNTACVLSWEEARRWQSRSSGYSSS